MIDQSPPTLDPSQDPALFEAIELLFFAYRAFTAQADTILAERGLARMHHRILYFVARRPGQRVSDLLATLGVSKQALHAPLKQLIARGLVDMRPDASDRRARCLSLSDEGAALERRLGQSQQALLTQVFTEQGAASAQSWREVMKALASANKAGDQ